MESSDTTRLDRVAREGVVGSSPTDRTKRDCGSACPCLQRGQVKTRMAPMHSEHYTSPRGSDKIVENKETINTMIPYTDEENQYLSSGSYRKSNQNRERRVQQQSGWYLPKHGYAIRTTIEVDGREYIVPVQL